MQHATIENVQKLTKEEQKYQKQQYMFKFVIL